MKITGPSVISGVKLSPQLEKMLESKASGKAEATGFSEMLSDQIQQIDEAQKVADQAAVDFAAGKSRNLHETVLAMEMADTSLRMAVTVRNKVIEAYQEIMRMPV